MQEVREGHICDEASGPAALEGLPGPRASASTSQREILLVCGLPPGPATCPALDCAAPQGACRQALCSHCCPWECVGR